MKSTSRRTGISFYQGRIQLAEIEHGKQAELVALGERETSIDFGSSSASLHAQHPQLTIFIYELEELMKQHRVHGKDISFALPTDPVFVNIMPVDGMLTKAEQMSHLHWELEQYFPESSAKDFVLSAHPLPSDDTAVKHLLGVAVRRTLIAFLRQAAQELRLSLTILDVDHFSTEKTLWYNYPELNAKTVALCGIQYGHVDASLLAQGELIDYRSYRIDGHDDVKGAISSYVRHVRGRDGVPQPSMLFFHGMDIPLEIRAQLQSELKVQITPLDALKKLSASKRLPAPFVKENTRFAAAIGVALRTS